jgi:hypothetical protein
MRSQRLHQAVVSYGILPIPPAPALLDEFLIEVHPIGQKHISNGASVLVLAEGLKCDLLPIDQF